MANVQKPPIEIGTKTKIHLAVTALIIAGLIIPAVFLGLFSAQLATAVFQMAGKSTTASTKRAVDYKPSSPLSSLLASAVSNFKQKGTSPSYAYYTQTDLNRS